MKTFDFAKIFGKFAWSSDYADKQILKKLTKLFQLLFEIKFTVSYKLPLIKLIVAKIVADFAPQLSEISLVLGA